MQEIEQEIVKILLNDEKVKEQSRPIYYWVYISNLKILSPYQNTVYYNKNQEEWFFISYETAIEVGSLIQKIFLQYIEEGKIYSDVEFEINPYRSYVSRYWFDEARLLKEEYDTAMLSAKDFPHAAATNLVNYYFFEIKFKRKFTRIHWIIQVKNEGEAFFEVYLVNQRNQKLPVELQETGLMFDIRNQIVHFEKYWKYKLLEHYEVTHNGILKDVWKPWNKIIINIPPNGYLNENEDIEYYLDDVRSEKGFFLRGY
jgi:hypothetical protein